MGDKGDKGDKDKDKGQDNRPQIVQPNDTNNALRDNEAVKEDVFTKDYDRPQPTIMDLTLSDVLDQTLNFIVYSFGDYQVQVRKAELLIRENDQKDKDKGKSEEATDKKVTVRDRLTVHGHAISLFIGDGDNSIYIGIILIMLSIIIYFINITTS